MKKNVLQIILMLLCFSQIVSAEQSEIDHGRFSDGVYQNHEIGIFFPVSEAWTIQDEDVRETIERLFLREKVTHHHLIFSIYKFEGSDNLPTGVHLFVSKLSSLTGVSKSSDYLHLVTGILMDAEGRNRVTVGSIRSGIFGGQEFKAVPFSTNNFNGEIHFTSNQYLYATVKGDYALSFYVTYGETGSDFDSARRLLQGLEFEK